MNRHRQYGDLGLQDRPSVPHAQPAATPPVVVARIEQLRRERKWSARRIRVELVNEGVSISVRTVGRVLARLGLNRRKFLDPNGEDNRAPQKIVARWPGHMVHVDIKKVGRIPDGGGWRIHGRGSNQANAANRAKTAGVRAGYVYLHSVVDGYSRLAYTEPLADEKAKTAVGFLRRAMVFFAAHGIAHVHRVVTDNGSCYRAHEFTGSLLSMHASHLFELLSSFEVPPALIKRTLGLRKDHLMPDEVTHLQTSNVRLTHAQSADLVHAYLAGASAKHLSERYGLSPRAVRSHIHRAGAPLRPKTLLTRSQAAELVELYRQGWTGADLAAKFSCSERTVFLELKRADVPSRPRGRQR